VEGFMEEEGDFFMADLMGLSSGSDFRMGFLSLVDWSIISTTTSGSDPAVDELFNADFFAFVETVVLVVVVVVVVVGGELEGGLIDDVLDDLTVFLLIFLTVPSLLVVAVVATSTLESPAKFKEYKNFSVFVLTCDITGLFSGSASQHCSHTSVSRLVG
jgi:hypothetical protein